MNYIEAYSNPQYELGVSPDSSNLKILLCSLMIGRVNSIDANDADAFLNILLAKEFV